MTYSVINKEIITCMQDKTNITVCICCPSALSFDIPQQYTQVKDFFGESSNLYDDVTNRNNMTPYWKTDSGDPPLPGTLSAPDIAESAQGLESVRDGSIWISVAIGEIAEFDLSIYGDECTQNIIFESEDPNIVEVLTAKMTENSMMFQFKGKSEGDVTLLAKCDGDVIGWVHAWCAERLTVKVSIATAITTKNNIIGLPNLPREKTSSSLPDGYDFNELQHFLNTVYNPALLNIDLIDLGVLEINKYDLDHPSDPQRDISLILKKLPSIPYKPEIFDSYYLTTTMHLIDDYVKSVTPNSKKQPYRLYYYLARSPSNLLGIANKIGGEYAYCFNIIDMLGSYSTLAHELGHLLGLRHPADTNNSGQYPDYFPKPELIDDNINTFEDNDLWNLMGYAGDSIQRGQFRKYLRLQQWKVVYKNVNKRNKEKYYD